MEKTISKFIKKEVKKMNSKLKLEFEHFTINEMPKLKIEDIKSVYIGKPYACRCGCSGVYYYPQINKELAGEDRGYQVEDDEINDEKVMRVYNKLVKFAKNGIDVQISLNKEYIFTIVIGKKEYSLYTI